MKAVLGAFAMAAALVATDVSAQGINLSGPYRCVNYCADGQVGSPAFVTQNGWDMNLVNEVGQPVRAWVDWPGHIWIERWNQGAIYSPDGMTIQFDRGTIWQRDVGQFDALVAPQSSGPRRSSVAPRSSVPPKARPVVKTKVVAAAPAPVRVAVPAPARGTATFDGSWSVLIVTETGACDPAYRYGFKITNGAVTSDSAGGGATMEGRVAPNGSVRVNVTAGGQSAAAEGTMAANVGTGTWQGQGSAGACAGTWLAQRSG